ncbi:MAG: hypothetical protein CMI56_03310 [Parcubacteria group bacterium]|nr:hypothetical protein [Parcubacteria group bacterium]
MAFHNANISSDRIIVFGKRFARVRSSFSGSERRSPVTTATNTTSESGGSIDSRSSGSSPIISSNSSRDLRIRLRGMLEYESNAEAGANTADNNTNITITKGELAFLLEEITNLEGIIESRTWNWFYHKMIETAKNHKIFAFLYIVWVLSGITTLSVHWENAEACSKTKFPWFILAHFTSQVGLLPLTVRDMGLRARTEHFQQKDSEHGGSNTILTNSNGMNGDGNEHSVLPSLQHLSDDQDMYLIFWWLFWLLGYAGALFQVFASFSTEDNDSVGDAANTHAVLCSGSILAGANTLKTFTIVSLLFGVIYVWYLSNEIHGKTVAELRTVAQERLQRMFGTFGGIGDHDTFEEDVEVVNAAELSRGNKRRDGLDPTAWETGSGDPVPFGRIDEAIKKAKHDTETKQNADFYI